MKRLRSLKEKTSKSFLTLSFPSLGQDTVRRSQGLRTFSCLTVGNELSEETHVLTKQKTLGKGCLGRE